MASLGAIPPDPAADPAARPRPKVYTPAGSGRGANVDEQWTARVWPTRAGVASFPERELTGLGPRLGAGVCFSGGGTRALSCALGQLRGLTALGLMERVGYVSGVSGGAWATTAYSFFCAGASDDEAFLGPLDAPGALSLDRLSVLSPACLGHTATRSLRSELWSGWERGTPRDRLWIESIGRLYLTPFGLHDPAAPAGFTWDAASLASMLARNPGLAGRVFHTVRPGRPYPVLNATLMGPQRVAPFRVEEAVNLQLGPLGVGAPPRLDVAYRPADQAPVQVTVGGGFVEPFAFGGPAPQAPPQGGLVRLAAPARLLSLADAAGFSSAFFGSFVEQAHWLGALSDLKALEPRLPMWPVLETSGPATTTDMALADGGVMENLGLIPLLQRGVTRIAVFVNTSVPLDPTWDPARPPSPSQIDSDLPPLFGVRDPSYGTITTHDQVFPPEDLAVVVRGLQAARQAGRPVVTVTRHRVQPNPWWGLAGGDEVQVAWVYNERVPAWEAQLPAQVQAAIDAGNHRLFAHGPFLHFPHYDTVGEDGLLDLVELTAAQVNLLAALSAWCVTESGDALRALFAL